jgi:hypothetical protein
MRQAKIVIGVEQHQLLPQTVLPLAQESREMLGVTAKLR